MRPLPLLLLLATACEGSIQGLASGPGARVPGAERTQLSGAALPPSAGDGSEGPCGAGSDAGLSAEGVRRATALSDTTGPLRMHDVAARIAGLDALFAACADRRGVFPAAYLPITRRAIEGIDGGRYADAAWAEALVVDFAVRYLDALHDELLGRDPGPGWRRYYELARDPGVGGARLAATAILVHLTFDLPETLVAIGTTAGHEADYLHFGDELVEVSPEVIAALQRSQQVDATHLLGGFFLGAWLDGAFGDAFTTRFAFTRIRAKAWASRGLIEHGFGWVARAEIAASLAAMDLFFAMLDAGGAL